MSKSKQYRSRVMASVHETAEGLAAAGIMNTQTMREGTRGSWPAANDDRAWEPYPATGIPLPGRLLVRAAGSGPRSADLSPKT